MSEQDWTFSYEGPLHETFPALHEAQSVWLAQIDSLQALDRKTHELVRMVCMVIARNGAGRLASCSPRDRGGGADWSEIVAAIALTQPGFGILPAAQSLPHARTGFEEGVRLIESELEDDGDDG